MNSAIRRITSTVARRNFSAAAAPRSNVYREKTTKELWFTDIGAYPVMFTILLGLCFSGGVTIWATTTNKDARLSDKTRKSLFRGEYADQYQHPVKPHATHH